MPDGNQVSQSPPASLIYSYLACGLWQVPRPALSQIRVTGVSSMRNTSQYTVMENAAKSIVMSSASHCKSRIHSCEEAVQGRVQIPNRFNMWAQRKTRIPITFFRHRAMVTIQIPWRLRMPMPTQNGRLLVQSPGDHSVVWPSIVMKSRRPRQHAASAAHFGR